MSVVVQSEVGIISAAALHLGKDPIADLGELEDTTAQIYRERYAAQRDKLLRTYPWNFAMRFESLAGKAMPTPLFGFTHSFNLPSGGAVGYCLKLWRLEKERVKYRVLGRKLLTTCSGPLNIEFVNREENAEIFDPIFAELLAVDLALVLINRLTTNEVRKRTRELQGYRNEIKRTARRSDAMEQSSGVFADAFGGTWISARRPM